MRINSGRYTILDAGYWIIEMRICPLIHVTKWGVILE